jgi:hypothetical protein
MTSLNINSSDSSDRLQGARFQKASMISFPANLDVTFRAGIAVVITCTFVTLVRLVRAFEVYAAIAKKILIPTITNSFTNF